MIEELADSFSELVISTGATFNDEIQTAAKMLNAKNKKFTFFCSDLAFKAILLKFCIKDSFVFKKIELLIYIFL